MSPRRLLIVLCALLATLVVAGGASARVDAPPPAPTGLKAFLLRADEPARHEFSRTPSFAWTPVRGATRYEFELAKTPSFGEGAIFWADAKLKAPAASVPLALPWTTGDPFAIYARVRAITTSGVTAWSAPYGFNVRWSTVPQPLPTPAGMSRWTPVEGATSYNVWFPDIRKVVSMRTNAVDHREFYAFHQQTQFSGTVRWRVRAVRSLYGRVPTGLPAVTYGPWSPLYTATNPAVVDGPLVPVATVADVTSSNAAAPALHELTPGFSFTGNQGPGAQAFELYRVYVFSDRDCVNVIHRGSLVASPAYVPRTSGALEWPGAATLVVEARSAYLKDAAPGKPEANQRMADSARVSSTEQDKAVAPTKTAAPAPSAADPKAAPPEDDPASTPPELDPSLPTTPVASGAPVDLWDSGWPNGRFYWTVVPVQFEPATAVPTALTTAAAAGSTVLEVGDATRFSAGILARIGTGAATETILVATSDVTAKTVTLASPLMAAHAAQARVEPIGSLEYWDQELPQDACSAARVLAFGKGSKPLVAQARAPYASGLSPAGRLVTARAAGPAFYGPPLVAWEPALGADQYQVQWSKTRYPWRTEGERLTYATSALLPLTPGRWYYRVRGINFALPGTARALSWSAPIGFRVTRPTFAVVKPAAPSPKKTTKRK